MKAVHKEKPKDLSGLSWVYRRMRVCNPHTVLCAAYPAHVYVIWDPNRGDFQRRRIQLRPLLLWQENGVPPELIVVPAAALLATYLLVAQTEDMLKAKQVLPAALATMSRPLGTCMC